MLAGRTQCCSCKDTCPDSTSDRTKGRVCDSSCEDGNPYGTHGCGVDHGIHGANCRLCYKNEEKAKKMDHGRNGRAIM